jgi:hypothetical protein
MFGGLFANSLLTIHKSKNNSRLLSPALWSRAVNAALAPDGYSGGVVLGDDFRALGIGTAVSSNVGYYVGGGGTYYSFEDTGGAIAQLATERKGAVRLSVDADDNQETWLQYGNATSVSAMISDTAGDDELLIFECRIRPNDVVGNRFVGLAEEGSAAGDFISDAGAMGDKDWIGFFTAEGAPTSLKFGYKKAGQTAVTVATAATLVEDAWTKLGFVYDPGEVPAKRIKFFVDNVEGTTYVTETNIAAATFPDGEEMSPIFGVKNVTDIMTMDVDWFALYTAG